VEHEQDDFGLHHRGELREALIMVEGDDGGFELLGHGRVARAGGDIDWAALRSSSSDNEYLFIHDEEHRPGSATCWHLADEAERAAVRGAVFRS
jgi:hypothetical protein